jgi:excinuclease ABC subunit C
MTTTSSADYIKKGETGFDRGAEAIRAQLKTMPSLPGVYRMIGSDGKVLYVGKAKNLKNRVTSYTQRARLPQRLQRMVAQVVTMEIVTTHTEAEALLLEANLIRRFAPPFNILLRDDKSYPMILIPRDHDFPALLKHRGAKKRKGWYFGPFASGSAVTETLNLLQRGFQLRTCSDGVFASRSRPCLQYHIKRCSGPCVNLVSKTDYADQVTDAVAFLRGQTQSLQQKFASAMKSASDALDYETAAKFRDRIRILTSIQARQNIDVPGLGDADIFGLCLGGGKAAIEVFFFRSDRNFGARTYFPATDKEEPSEILASFVAQFYDDKPVPPLLILSHEPAESQLLAEALSTRAERKVSLVVPQMGEKKKLADHAIQNAKTALARKSAESDEQTRLLQKVAELFGLAEAPNRIEVYDNSHTGGSFAIGAMIAAGPTGFLKKTYRKYNIKSAATNDDFAMMREVLTRRFERLAAEDPERKSGLWPDLLLIDGGQGQLTQVVGVLAEMGISDIPVVGIAKGPDRNAGREHFFMEGKPPFALPHEDPVLYYLQRLRDEAHRFAIGTHRARRAKALVQSGLEEVGGIGSARKKALLLHFGSAKAVKEAGIEDLARTPGISPALAKKIYETFHPEG